MAFVGMEDKLRVEGEMPWEDRDVPATLHKLLSRTAGQFPDHKAISFQLLSGPTDKGETLTWSQLLDKTNQAANLFRSLGVK
ncbi:acyl-CoA synthetase, partial [Cribrihabitans sp. XS_ASV171]